MKHKISILILIFLQAGCAVELRDRNQEEEVSAPTATELKVDNEYTLPVPLIMSEQVVLRYDRLILGKNAKLITQGLNVRFEVKELIAEDAEILTFKSDQYAPLGSNGRRGGNVEIVAENAIGNLRIVMQGEHGGMGFNGREPDESLRGPKGATGRSALWILNSIGSPLYILARRAENGAPGGQALPGYPGGNGFRGGDCGTALVKITNEQDFHLVFQRQPGSGGDGGPGGAGGPGGFGGDPGVETMPHYNGPPVHNYTVPGPMGAQGPQGPKGARGPSGNIEKVCMQIGSEELLCE